MATTNILRIVEPIHSRIESILERLVDAEFGGCCERKHLKCKPRTCYVSFGKQQDEEYVEFFRHCADGLLSARLPRAAFENDNQLMDVLDASKRARIVAAEERKQERYRTYLELKNEFQ